MVGKGRRIQEVLEHHRVERAARMYRTNKDAAEAMGIRPNSFYRYCKRHGIETPNQRAKARKQAAMREREMEILRETQAGTGGFRES